MNSPMQAGLAAWFAIGHRRYRALLTQLLVAGTLGSALAYLDNFVLTGLTDSLTATLSASTPTTPAAPPFAPIASTLGVSLPVAILGLFVVARLLSAAVAFWRARVGGKLRIESRNDLEAEVLMHLLRKDDTFFSAHSPAETVNRLAVDVFRVSERRPNLMTIWWSALLIVGSLVFFLQRDARLALVALAACAGGALWTYRITRNVSSFDRDYLSQDDRVKSQFEDMLRAAPEIQVGNLFARARTRFEARQLGRTRIYGRYVSLRAMLQVANVVSALVAFAAMIGILLWLSRGGEGRSALVLVPAVIWALPRLFDSASELIFIRLDFQLARTSMERLLQYETPPIAQHPAPSVGTAAPTQAPTATRDRAAGEPAPSLQLCDLSFQYLGPDGSRQGGVSGVDTTFAPGEWTALVGGAGSGKSTLLKLLLGRLEPLEGEIRYGDSSLAALGPSELARLLSLMPQAPALLNSSIGDNLLFARDAQLLGATEGGGGADAPARRAPAVGGDLTVDALSAADLDVIERAGLGRVCRLKALDLQPDSESDFAPVAKHMASIRARVRAAVKERCGLAVRSYDTDGFDPQQWWCESLLGGRCDRTAAEKALLGGKADGRPLLELVDAPASGALEPVGRRVLADSKHLLRLPSYQRYAQLAAVPISEAVWQLRSSSAHRAGAEARSTVDRAALLAVALTSTPAECAELPSGSDREAILGARGDEPAGALARLLGDAWQPFCADAAHPRLTWRENLLFGVLDTSNSRAARLVDQVLLELIEAPDLREAFTRVGLGFNVGRKGANLSGGQGQLVALCRALLRRTSILVLDEPTSALDPASRAAVAELLRDWRQERIVLTVSHDPELVRHADQVRLMEGGRLVASGTFAELLESSEAFRNIMRQS